MVHAAGCLLPEGRILAPVTETLKRIEGTNGTPNLPFTKFAVEQKNLPRMDRMWMFYKDEAGIKFLARMCSYMPLTASKQAEMLMRP